MTNAQPAAVRKPDLPTGLSPENRSRFGGKVKWRQILSDGLLGKGANMNFYPEFPDGNHCCE
jgi:hypothetical protein